MPEPHPTDRHLAALIDGRLSGEMAESVRSHVRECAALPVPCRCR